jgi:hypothetical protein
MGFVFKINEELASITVTASELLSVTRTITGLIKNQAFVQLFSGIIGEINKSYGVILDSFAPFYELDSEEKFVQRFDEIHQAFKGSYLLDVSKPHKYFENVYDAYIEMRHTKEIKTGFPLLKDTFSRLDEFYDKWITNDSYLALNIDGALKLKNRLLNEIAELKQKDEEYAYLRFASALDDFRDYITFIQDKSNKVASLVIIQ